MPPLELALFDMDGVLADTEPLHLEALNDALAAEGVRLEEREAARFLGQTDRVLLATLAAEGRISGPVHRYQAEKERRLMERVEQAVLVPSEGVAELLLRLRMEGVRTAVASSSPRRLVETVVGRLGLRRAFDALFSGDQVARCKPAPDLFLLAARRLGAAPRATVVFEDAPHGVRAAKAAGMRVIAVRSAAVAPEALAGADLVVGSLAEIDAAALVDGVVSRG